MQSAQLCFIPLHFEYDLLAARRKARQLAALLGFDSHAQIRIAAIAAEMARVALRSGGGGRLELGIDEDALVMIASGRAPAKIAELALVRRLVDVRADGVSTSVRVPLPAGAPAQTAESAARIADELTHPVADTPLAEFHQQNRDLLQALARVDELTRAVEAVTAEGPRLRVLIVDDDEVSRDTLGGFVMAPDTEILEAEDGLAGIARAATDRPDLIMLDLMMPGVGGHEVLARLKSDPATAQIPVVVVTSRFVNDDERTEILSRAANVIYKGELSRDTVAKAIADAIRAIRAPESVSE